MSPRDAPAPDMSLNSLNVMIMQINQIEKKIQNTLTRLYRLLQKYKCCPVLEPKLLQPSALLVFAQRVRLKSRPFKSVECSFILEALFLITE